MKKPATPPNRPGSKKFIMNCFLFVINRAGLGEEESKKWEHLPKIVKDFYKEQVKRLNHKRLKLLNNKCLFVR